MNHADPQSTGRSKYKGPRKGTIKHIIDSLDIVRTVSMPDDTTFLVVSRGVNKYYGISKFTIEGEFIWNFTDNKMISDAPTPLPLKSGNILYSTGLLKELYLLNKNGEKIWEKIFPSAIISQSFIPGKDGTIYFIDVNRTLYAIDESGNIKWEYNNQEIYPFAGMSFSPDGKTLYLRGNTKSVISFDVTTQQIKWTFGNDKITAPPLVDYEGNIYTLSTINDSVYLHSLSPEGNVRWFSYINLHPQFIMLTPSFTMDNFGNIYLTATYYMYSFNYIGELRWIKNFGEMWGHSYVISDSEGIIYTVGTISGQINDIYKLIILNSDGIIINEIILDNMIAKSYSNAITKDGKLILPSTRSKRIYIIE